MARLMRQTGFKSLVRRRYKPTTIRAHGPTIAPNLLDRQFEAEAPNRRGWVGDTTELLTGSGKLYLAARSWTCIPVGSSAGRSAPSTTACRRCGPLRMALEQRCPGVGLTHHSDQGCTYASDDCRRHLGAHGTTCSMSRRGGWYDNAAKESRSSTQEPELGERLDYIEVLYNQRRCHPTLGCLSPAQYERINGAVEKTAA